jgi:hypothetical protein
MSTGTILYFAIGVFTLMVIGIILTAVEFKDLDKQSRSTKGKASRDQ